MGQPEFGVQAKEPLCDTAKLWFGTLRAERVAGGRCHTFQFDSKQVRMINYIGQTMHEAKEGAGTTTNAKPSREVKPLPENETVRSVTLTPSPASRA